MVGILISDMMIALATGMLLGGGIQQLCQKGKRGEVE